MWQNPLVIQRLTAANQSINQSIHRSNQSINQSINQTHTGRICTFFMKTVFSHFTMEAGSHMPFPLTKRFTLSLSAGLSFSFHSAAILAPLNRRLGAVKSPSADAAYKALTCSDPVGFVGASAEPETKKLFESYDKQKSPGKTWEKCQLGLFGLTCQSEWWFPPGRFRQLHGHCVKAPNALGHPGYSDVSVECGDCLEKILARRECHWFFGIFHGQKFGDTGRKDGFVLFCVTLSPRLRVGVRRT